MLHRSLNRARKQTQEIIDQLALLQFHANFFKIHQKRNTDPYGRKLPIFKGTTRLSTRQIMSNTTIGNPGRMEQDDRHNVDVIYMDFSKSFDKVCHRLLYCIN